MPNTVWNLLFAVFFVPLKDFGEKGKKWGKNEYFLGLFPNAGWHIKVTNKGPGTLRLYWATGLLLVKCDDNKMVKSPYNCFNFSLNQLQVANQHKQKNTKKHVYFAKIFISFESKSYKNMKKKI